jgi:hypothetical protein
MRRAYSTKGEKRNAYRILVGQPEGRPKSRWVANTTTDLIEIGCGRTDWIDLAEDRNKWRALENTVMHFRLS